MKRRLELAADHYKRATQLKPRENAFWDPKNRVDFLLWQATGLVAQVEAFEQAKKDASKGAHKVPSRLLPSRICSGGSGSRCRLP